MNTLEILNLAQNEENQGKKVKSSAFPDMEYEIRDKFIFAFGGMSAIAVYGHIERGAEWSFVKDNVDFMTAIKAFHSGKTISCEVKRLGTFEYNQKDWYLTDSRGGAITSEEILEGIWTIED